MQAKIQMMRYVANPDAIRNNKSVDGVNLKTSQVVCSKLYRDKKDFVYL